MTWITRIHRPCGTKLQPGEKWSEYKYNDGQLLWLWQYNHFDNNRIHYAIVNPKKEKENITYIQDIPWTKTNLTSMKKAKIFIFLML